MERPPSHPPDRDATDEEHDEDTPYGAIIVTTVVAVVILVMWYGMYALNLARS